MLNNYIENFKNKLEETQSRELIMDYLRSYEHFTEKIGYHKAIFTLNGYLHVHFFLMFQACVYSPLRSALRTRFMVHFTILIVAQNSYPHSSRIICLCFLFLIEEGRVHRYTAKLCTKHRECALPYTLSHSCYVYARVVLALK